MRITGDEKSAHIVFDNPWHGEWKQQQQMLSVDAVTATLNDDGSISIRSRGGRLVLNHEGFVLVFPSWFDPQAEQVVDSKVPVFKSRVCMCYKVTQKTAPPKQGQQKNGKPSKASGVRCGYIFSFQEKPNKDQ
jgi:hypothetical protein